MQKLRLLTHHFVHINTKNFSFKFSLYTQLYNSACSPCALLSLLQYLVNKIGFTSYKKNKKNDM